MPAEASRDDDLDPFMLHLRSRATIARERIGIPVEPKHVIWPTTLVEPPSAAEFRELVELHRPVLIEQCMQGKQAATRWKDSQYLIKRMGPDRKVAIALTPDGAADDIVILDDLTKAFALPREEQMPLGDLLGRFAKHGRTASDHEEVAYLQSQNSNLETTEFGDLSPLLDDISCSSDQSAGRGGRSDLAWATEAMGYEPNATNIWIGTSASRTSMHRDYYENLFTVIRGWKEFTVFPPFESCFMCDDEEYPVYRYTRTENGTLQLQTDSTTLPTRWIPIDPTQPKDSTRNRPYTYRDLNIAPPQPVLNPSSAQTRYGYALPPLTIRVNEGQTLYLPSGWFHHVSQKQDSQIIVKDGVEIDLGVCLCLNWWYEITDDMAMRLADMDMAADDTEHI